MLAVIQRPAEYHIREIFRWYSETFHTPLKEVDTLPFDEVLQHYFERHYRDLEGPDLDQELVRLARTEEEQAEFERKERLNQTEDSENFNDLRKQLDEARKAGQSLADTLKKPAKPDSKAVLTPKPLEKMPEKLPEGIQMNFTDDGGADDPDVPDKDPLDFALFNKGPRNRTKK